MVNLNLIKSNHPILKKPCEEFDFNNSREPVLGEIINPEEFAKDLIAVMYAKGGVGLSANQVGYPFKVFAMRGMPEDFVFFNPKVVSTSGEETVSGEACLSYPGIVLNIKRPQEVRIRFQGPDGQTYTKQFAGMTARIVLHELDHLDGVPFINKVSKMKAEMAINKSNKHYGTNHVYRELISRNRM